MNHFTQPSDLVLPLSTPRESLAPSASSKDATGLRGGAIRKRLASLLTWTTRALLVVAVLPVSSAFANEVIVLRSGQVGGLPGTPGVFGGPNDDNLTYIRADTWGVPVSTTAFVAADFTAALAGPKAILVWPLSAWNPQSLPCDPDARWISWSQTVSYGGGSPAYSALYGQTFNVATPSATVATVSLCWAVDDSLGDAHDTTPPNPAGLFINGVPAGAAFTGGGWGGATTVVATGVPINTGANTMHIYARDYGGSRTGLIFSCTITIETDPPGQPACFGQGCPCSNDSPISEEGGCLNTVGSAGKLTGTGLPFSEYSACPSTSPPGLDTVTLTATGLPSNVFGIAFRGTTNLNGGAGLPFGYGLRCCGGQITRSGAQSSGAGGVMNFGYPVSKLSVKTLSCAATTYCYQVWYRDPVFGGPLCAEPFNTTNAYEITWLP